MTKDETPVETLSKADTVETTVEPSIEPTIEEPQVIVPTLVSPQSEGLITPNTEEEEDDATLHINPDIIYLLPWIVETPVQTIVETPKSTQNPDFEMVFEILESLMVEGIRQTWDRQNEEVIPDLNEAFQFQSGEPSFTVFKRKKRKVFTKKRFASVTKLSRKGTSKSSKRVKETSKTTIESHRAQMDVPTTNSSPRRTKSNVVASLKDSK
ncbi:hypothetical protein L6452_14833 [Arctium lappa]|uniref:Uncharacterized protein n=1 Tax=Arctium lappa TaxID=4217 RepID=A0ACB9CLZ6_ARCLA|nr:hypothetical protein L6452_14833 [Arctium lappa]